jgi:hypothetical protein
VLPLRITTPLGAQFSAEALVRHLSESKGVCGVKVQNLSADATQQLRRAVSELLTRGQQA